jgi:hypothetical protein
MPPLPHPMQAYFLSRSVTSWLAAVVVIWMAVAPIPIRPLRLSVYFSNRTIRFVLRLEITAIDAVFVVIPIVVVLVVTIIDLELLASAIDARSRQGRGLFALLGTAVHQQNPTLALLGARRTHAMQTLHRAAARSSVSFHLLSCRRAQLKG